MIYPKELLPQPNYNLIDAKDVCDSFFIRETGVDLYKQIEAIGESNIQQLSDFIVPEVRGIGRPSEEVFEMSLFLFGTFTEEHLGIVVENKELTRTDWNPGNAVPKQEEIPCHKEDKYALYISCKKLFNRKELEFNDSKYDLSYEHKPNLVNYWHFQLFSEEDNLRIKRDLRAYEKPQQKKYKRLAKHLLETMILDAVCTDKQAVLQFQ